MFAFDSEERGTTNGVTYGPGSPQPSVTPAEHALVNFRDLSTSCLTVDDLPLSTPAYSPNPGHQFSSRSAGLKLF